MTPADHARIIRRRLSTLAEFAALDALQAQAETAGRLPDDTVCACLSETGERKVEIVERCMRCGSLMYSDAYHDAEAERDRLRDASKNVLDAFDHGDDLIDALWGLRAALAGEDKP